jgi:DNA-binding MarR family transcriptional regulator
MNPRSRGRSDGLAELLARADYLLRADFAREVRRYGLRYGEWRVLAALRDHDGQRMSELAQNSLFTSSALTHVVDRMQERGLVERRCSAGDRRHVRVFLTRRGQRTVVPLALSAHHHSDALSLGLGEATAYQLKTALRQLIDRFEPIHREGSMVPSRKRLQYASSAL